MNGLRAGSPRAFGGVPRHRFRNAELVPETSSPCLEHGFVRTMRPTPRMSHPAPPAPEPGQTFDRFRQRAGLFVAPLVGVVLWFLPIDGLTTEAHRLLAILGTVVVLWITEAMPLPVTALLGPTLCVLASVVPPQAGANPAREI